MTTSETRTNQGRASKFTVLNRSGSEKLSRILTSSWNGTRRPADCQRSIVTTSARKNYSAGLLGTDVQAGRTCYVLELLARTKSRLLVNGKAWVDDNNFELVRLEGTTAASVFNVGWSTTYYTRVQRNRRNWAARPR